MADDKNINKTDHGKIFFSWRFSEFTQHERNRNWYIWASVAIGVLLLYAIFAHNYIFGLIMIIAALTLAMFQRSNNEVTVGIAEDGILVNQRFYDYKNLKNFF